MLKYGTLLLLIAATTYADLLSEAGDFFSKHFTDFKSLFADNEKELQQNMDRLRDLLITIQEKMSLLKPLADDAQKATLEKIGSLVSQVNNFQKNVFNAKLDFNQKRDNWEHLIKNIFVTEGLNKILPLLQKIQNSAPATFTTLLLTCIAPLLSIALRE
uniref:Uncharacterized protein n=1 Tax=Setaria digitata TaxID=48799 RepID=A0A915PPG3_9BILA